MRVRVCDAVDVCVLDTVVDLEKKLEGVVEIVAEPVAHDEVVDVDDVDIVEVIEAVEQAEEVKEGVNVEECVGVEVTQAEAVADIDVLIVKLDVVLIVDVRDVTGVKECEVVTENVGDAVIDSVFVTETVPVRVWTGEYEELEETEGDCEPDGDVDVEGDILDESEDDGDIVTEKEGRVLLDSRPDDDELAESVKQVLSDTANEREVLDVDVCVVDKEKVTVDVGAIEEVAEVEALTDTDCD